MSVEPDAPLDPFAQAGRDPKPERIDRLLPEYGRLPPIIEMANLGEGTLRLVLAWISWAERIRRASITPENPTGRTWLFKQIETALMGSMATRGRRNQQVLESLIAGHLEEIQAAYSGLAPDKSRNGAQGRRAQAQSARAVLEDEGGRALKRMDQEVERVG